MHLLPADRGQPAADYGNRTLEPIPVDGGSALRVFSALGASGPCPDEPHRGCGPSFPGRKIPRRSSAAAYRDRLLGWSGGVE